MRIARKAALLLALLLASYFGCGYATAWARLEQCRMVTVKEVLESKITGRGFVGETIVLTEKDVNARISGPFQVQTYFMVPTGMHGTVNSQLFLVLPWVIQPGKRQKHDLM